MFSVRVLHIIWLSIFSIFFHGSLFSQSLVINEIQSSNSTTICDEYGEYCDWIELYNGTSSSINLLGYSLSDNEDNPQKWIFPSITIGAGEFILVFASGRNQYEGEYLHTNFSISKDGEEILLSNAAEVIIDVFEPVELLSDNSYGRLTDGSNEMSFFLGATPGESNNGQPPFVDYPDIIQFSHQQGFYSNQFSLGISCSNTDAKIYYTLNGEEPDQNSKLYTGPILIYNREQDDNGISMIRTNPETAPESYVWKEPASNIFKGTVIKVRAYHQDQDITPLYTMTYLVHPQMFTKYAGLPVISIVTDSTNLFDYYTGIYVAGNFHDINPDWTWPWGTGNYHQEGDDWERPANMTFFEGNGSVAFQQDVGIRIHGDGSRALPEKSLRIYARSVYGKNSINYKFFEDKDISSFKRILLRNGGQDFLTTMITDEVVQSIVKDVDIESQASRPCIVFINGEFWGIHNIRKRIDEYFLEGNRDVNPDSVNILEIFGAVKEGTNQYYVELMNFIAQNDITIDSNYEWVEQHMDIVNYIDYIIVKQFISIYDWPGNNIAFWQENSQNSKWRWLLYDNDCSLVNYDFNTIIHSTQEGGIGWPVPDTSTYLLRNLLKNQRFEQLYLDRFEYHLLNTFTEEKMNAKLDEIENLIAFVMPEHIARWNYPNNLGAWHYHVNNIRVFFENRPCYMLSHIIDFFDIEDPTYGCGVCDSINIADMSYVNNLIVVWPNPVQEILNVEIQDTILHFESIEIIDLSGRKVADIPINSSDENQQISINVSELNEGVYILSVRIGRLIANKRFVKI